MVKGSPVKIVLFLASLGIVGPLAPQPLYGEGFEKSVVQVTSYSQAPDFDAPWRRKQVKSSNHLGVAVLPNVVLVSAHATAHHTMIEINRVGETMKIPMETIKVDFNINLALIRPKGDQKLNLTPVEIGGDLAIGKRATLISGRRKQRLYGSPIRLSEVSVRQVLTSYYVFTHYLFDVSQKTGLGWSEPILDENGRLTALGVGQESDTLYATPGKVIKNFIADWQSGNYRGLTMLGIGIRPLESPHLRSYLEIPLDLEGVLVTQIYAHSPFFGKVEKNDILVQLGNVKINKNGFYNHPLWGKVHFIDILTRYAAGDEIELTVVRRGQKIVIKEKSRPFDQNKFLIPGYPYGVVPHLIFGGLMFQELNLGFLKTWGDRWKNNAPEAMVFSSAYENKSSQGKRIIILNRVLSDSHNRGYEGLTNSVLVSCNGRPIHSLDQLKEALKNPENTQQPLARFDFSIYDGEIILDYQGLEESHKRIAKTYNIKSSSSFYSH